MVLVYFLVTLRRNYTSLKPIKVIFCFVFLSLHTFILVLSSTEVNKLICLTFVQFSWPFPRLFLEFYSQKNTSGPKTFYSHKLKRIFVWLTHAYRAMIKWKQIYWPVQVKSHARRLATQAAINKMATTSLSNCGLRYSEKTSY